MRYRSPIMCDENGAFGFQIVLYIEFCLGGFRCRCFLYLTNDFFSRKKYCKFAMILYKAVMFKYLNAYYKLKLGESYLVSFF